jgi:ABC-type bacteriocin/lantibiotic exporter with double-glycine peptidase domain
MKLAVPRFKQQYPYTCVPACVRMVLAYWGRNHSERELAIAFHTVTPLGTQPEAVEEGLKQLGYNCRWFENATVEKLQQLLAADWPVIIFLYAADLPHGSSGVHALVLIPIDKQRAVFLDPSLNRDLKLDLKLFETIWTKFGNQGMVIWI